MTVAVKEKSEVILPKIEMKNNRRLEINRGIKGGQSGIDRAFRDEKYQGVIHGVAVMTSGNVKDSRGWEIDQIALDQIVAAGNAYANLGLKSRFGHPNISGNALGTFLGRAKNFYRDGAVTRADLYISKTAYDTPEGDLASYVLDLAEKDPEAFGTSVVLGEYELEYKLNTDGTQQKDANGDALPPVLRVQSLMAVDVVDDPAANNSLFGKFFNDSVQLSAKATDFLDNLLNNPDAVSYVIAFLERFRVNRVEIDETKVNKNPSKTTTEEVEMLDLKELTLDQLKKDRPDLISALQTEAKSEATGAERLRSGAIMKAMHTEFVGMGMEAVALEAVETGKTIDAALAAMRGKRLEDLNKKSPPPPGPDAPAPEVKKDHLTKAREYQAQHKCSIVEALQKTAEPSKV